MEPVHGLIIKQLREKNNFSQEDLAQKLGDTTKQSVSNWETGRSSPSASDFRRLAQLFGVTIDYIITGQPTNVVNEPPVGYTLVRTEELIELQRQKITAQTEEIERLKNP